ncbi:hypothetical protein SAMN02745123_00005 [Desulforamulus aeronauticus DSM 10349]|uniref:Uncharacterized protein n=1 Tax=Desulforamulus aeronauticus DSM 10349 TaxID=1121421 RepID=A0A1M6NAB5_9FIRM|nr:hypothetical protein SAMN02745123_00005 [Desulforamulus aeronauticus DSM 10349]
MGFGFGGVGFGGCSDPAFIIFLILILLLLGTPSGGCCRA